MPSKNQQPDFRGQFNVLCGEILTSGPDILLQQIQLAIVMICSNPFSLGGNLFF